MCPHQVVRQPRKTNKPKINWNNQAPKAKPTKPWPFSPTNDTASSRTVYTHHRTLRLLSRTENHQIMKDARKYFQMPSQILGLQRGLPWASINDWGLTLWAVWSHITSTWKMREINMSGRNWTKPDWVRKFLGRKPKSSFGKKKKLHYGGNL